MVIITLSNGASPIFRFGISFESGLTGPTSSQQELGRALEEQKEDDWGRSEQDWIDPSITGTAEIPKEEGRNDIDSLATTLGCSFPIFPTCSRPKS